MQTVADPNVTTWFWRIMAGAASLVLLYLWPVPVVVGALVLAATLLLQDSMPRRLRARRSVTVGAAIWAAAVIGAVAAFVWPVLTVATAFLLLLGAVGVDLLANADRMGHDLAHDMRVHHARMSRPARRGGRAR